MRDITDSFTARESVAGQQAACRQWRSGVTGCVMPAACELFRTTEPTCSGVWNAIGGAIHTTDVDQQGSTPAEGEAVEAVLLRFGWSRPLQLSIVAR